MLSKDFAHLANYMWRQSIKNINNLLSAEEASQFSSNDYYYLTTIYYLNRPNFSQVSESFGLTKPAISLIIKKLTRMGLLHKEQSQEDKRVFYIVVTDKGKRIIEGDEVLYEGIDVLIRKHVVHQEQYEQLELMLHRIVQELTAGEDK